MKSRLVISVQYTGKIIRYSFPSLDKTHSISHWILCEFADPLNFVRWHIKKHNFSHSQTDNAKCFGNFVKIVKIASPHHVSCSPCLPNKADITHSASIVYTDEFSVFNYNSDDCLKNIEKNKKITMLTQVWSYRLIVRNHSNYESQQLLSSRMIARSSVLCFFNRNHWNYITCRHTDLYYIQFLLSTAACVLEQSFVYFVYSVWHYYILYALSTLLVV